MSEVFGVEFFAANRERLRMLFTGSAPIVITANGSLQRASDEAFPFYQDRNFWYLTGIDLPDVVLVLDKGKEYLIVPERSSVREVFDGAIAHDELARVSGIKDVRTSKDGWRQLEARLKKVQHVATLAANPTYIDALGIYSNPARARLIKRMKSVNSNLELLDLRQHLARMRMVKQPVEIAAIQKSVDITISAIKEALRPSSRSKYSHEFELEADLTRGFRRRGASGHAFEPIVAGGVRACTLHHVSNDAPLASDELVVLDVGARYNQYAADITRTVALHNGPTTRQQNIYDAVAAVQDYALSLLKPGVVLGEYEACVIQFMGEKLRELGLIKTISDDTVRQFYPHATSHFLGLDTHDSGDYTRPLEPGVVLTVEPGIYVADESIGIRIEDDVLITDNGAHVLSSQLPRELY